MCVNICTYTCIHRKRAVCREVDKHRVLAVWGSGFRVEGVWLSRRKMRGERRKEEGKTQEAEPGGGGGSGRGLCCGGGETRQLEQYAQKLTTEKRNH